MAANELSLEELWQHTLHVLQGRNALSHQQMAFVRVSQLMGFLGTTALIAAPNDMTKEILETRVRFELADALSQVNGWETRFAVTVDPEVGRGSESVPAAGRGAEERVRRSIGVLPAPPTNVRDSAESDQRGFQRELPPEASYPEPRETFDGGYVRPSDRSGASAGHQSRLNAKYTFDSFVIGASNRFAHAAAVAVAEAPAKAYNPLFIYGDSGLGKTHLLHAVGHYSQGLYPGVRVRYVNSEEFTNDFINSIRDDMASAFQARYREVDVLLIDDIQFLQRAERTMEEFFHTFNTLHNASKQIVITSDLPPKKLSGFEERMRSRFEWGLLTDVQPPDLETRIAILRKKVSYEDLQVGDDVLEYIASRISTNIRELEGALIRVTAYANLSRQPIDVSLAEFVLKDLINDAGDSEITASDIMAHTTDYFGMSHDDLVGSNRTRALVNARQIAMYLCREMTDMSLIKIGKEFGGRDHTTVIHANKKIADLMKERRAIFNQVTELTTRIRNGAKN